MRITLTIDADLEDRLNRQARAQGLSFEEAVNPAIRAGLGQEAVRARPSVPPKAQPHSFGFKPGIDLDKLRRIGFASRRTGPVLSCWSETLREQEAGVAKMQGRPPYHPLHVPVPLVKHASSNIYLERIMYGRRR